ncbi:MAG: hypothetical protein JEZ08_13260 [Clostridiales bacterium]|nr:hypothetical protein [Clostridiales bacterium]
MEKKKSDISASDIKSNILNYVYLSVNVKGILSFEFINNELVQEMSDLGYEYEEDYFTEQDLEYHYPKSKHRSLVDNERIVRFKCRESSCCLLISKFFISLYIDFKVARTFNTKVNHFLKLLSLLEDLNSFLRVTSMILRKNNSILVNSENKILDCLETRVNNNTALELKRIMDVPKIELYPSSSIERFLWDDYRVIIRKKILRGILEENGKDVKTYELVFDVIGERPSYMIQDETQLLSTIRDDIHNLNDKLFQVFKVNLSIGFLKDLENGESNRVVRGVTSNE